MLGHLEKQSISLHPSEWWHGWWEWLWVFSSFKRATKEFIFPKWVRYSISMKLHLNMCPFQAMNAFGWVVSISLLLAANLAMYPLSQVENNPSIMDDALYNVFSRLLWAIALSYIIFACVHGYGGPGNWFLSLKIWQPIARLSYSMYLVQYGIMTIFNGSMRDAPFFSDNFVVSNYFGIYHIIIRFTLYFLYFRFKSFLPIIRCHFWWPYWQHWLSNYLSWRWIKYCDQKSNRRKM